MTSTPPAPSRSSGILAHLTSLPGPYGIGSMGAAARRFVDFLAQAGQQYWQIMPLGPTGYGDSPYACFSAFAGNPYLISLDALAEQGLLLPADLAACPAFPEDQVDFGPVIEWHLAMLRKAYAAFRAGATPTQRTASAAFAAAQKTWLADYARFMAYKDANGGAIWNTWSVGARRITCALPRDLADAVQYHTFVQWQFFTQWFALKQYANSKGIRIIGDAPIFVAYDSADVWANPHLFKLDASGAMTVVAGVPPDYFSATGQLWGNPLYRWDMLKSEGYAWWIARLRWLLTTVDILRIDHFRGFEACWEVPAGQPTAEKGAWVKVPGRDFFMFVKKTLGDLPVIAEDLGVITPKVERIRDEFGFPGMKVLQFGFGGDSENTYLPHHYTAHTVVYTGTHDNDTACGWYASAGPAVTDHLRRYLGRDGQDIAWDMIRAAFASVSAMAIVPLQDVLSLGSTARLNFPGKPSGNWQWRFTAALLNGGVAERLRDMTELYGRLAQPAG